MANLIKFGQGLYDAYVALASKDQYQVYFCTDTHQIFVGADEYTKGTKVIGAEPTEATEGDKDRLYAYNGNLYLCSGKNSVDPTKYVWTRVANVSDATGSVTSVAAGDGLETESGSAITTTGTIKHSVPSGAATVVDPIPDQSPAFGSTFANLGVATDKFGHVTGVNVHLVELPNETAVTVTDATGDPVSLAYGSTFAAITGVGMSTAAGATNHDLVGTAQVFTLPASPSALTYTISSESEGVVTLTGSDASSSTAAIYGWSDLAKKSDITAVFRYKGSVASEADLPAIAEVGDVYQVGTDEYVCITASETGTPPAEYEKLGPVVDLSAYATTAYVDDKLTWRTF